MMLVIPGVLDAPAVRALRELLDAAGDAWVDGRATAGHQGAGVKFNQQIDEASEVARRGQAIVAAALERHPTFISAALPNLLYPPLFNRYGEGMAFGPHVDGSVRLHPHTGRKLRTDISGTLFLSDPDDYEGGALQVQDGSVVREARLPAGDLVLYPATSVHCVTPVTRGVRVASFFWVQSLVRDAEDRRLLFDLDGAIQRLAATDADAAARVTLVGTYHNLLRKWTET
jgi:PKHD-type hydroxylase